MIQCHPNTSLMSPPILTPFIENGNKCKEIVSHHSARPLPRRPRLYTPLLPSLPPKPKPTPFPCTPRTISPTLTHAAFALARLMTLGGSVASSQIPFKTPQCLPLVRDHIRTHSVPTFNRAKISEYDVFGSLSCEEEWLGW